MSNELEGRRWFVKWTVKVFIATLIVSLFSMVNDENLTLLLGL